MTIREYAAGHLTLRTVELQQNSTRKDTVLILGNAYGVMSYQEPLARALAQQGFEPWWFPFSGQEGTPGCFDKNSVLQDIKVAVNHIKDKRPDESMFVIAHCMGGLIALEYLGQHPDDHACIEKMIVYGLLFNPARRWKHAIPRLRKSGVNLGFTLEDANYDPLPNLSLVNVPLLFCHAKDKLNLRRATEQEIAMAVKAAPEAEVAWFEKGYDKDLGALPAFVEHYCSWLKKNV